MHNHFFAGTVYFNHSHGCMKCTAVGEYYKDEHHMSFKNFDAPKRTDVSFRERADPDHHKYCTPLEKIRNLNMVEDFPVTDSLHLLDEGLMKRNLLGWMNGSFGYRTKWRAADITKISELIVGFNSSKPVELHRSFRKLDHVKYWKALEFKYFLVYLSPVVLKDFLPTDVYEHFLLVFCGVTICSSELYKSDLELADKLFKEYVELYLTINGEDSITSNIHNVIHIVDDVKKFGILQNISAYPFENELYKIKNLLRSGNKPLAQVAKRLSEKSSVESRKPEAKYPKLYNETTFENYSSKKCFAKIQVTESISFKNDEKNKWFLTKNDEIVEFLFSFVEDHTIYLYGKSLRRLFNFFTTPFDSSHLSIYESIGTQNEPSMYHLSDLKAKMFAMKYKENFVFVPLHHTLDFFRNYE